MIVKVMSLSKLSG